MSWRISFKGFFEGGKGMDKNKKQALNSEIAVAYLMKQLLKEKIINIETYEKAAKGLEGNHHEK